MKSKKKKTSKRRSDFGITLDTGEMIEIDSSGKEPDEMALQECLLIIYVVKGIVPGLPTQEAFQLCYDVFSGRTEMEPDKLGSKLAMLQNSSMMRQ